VLGQGTRSHMPQLRPSRTPPPPKKKIKSENLKKREREHNFREAKTALRSLRRREWSWGIKRVERFHSKLISAPGGERVWWLGSPRPES